jgi:hypothetical protein
VLKIGAWFLFGMAGSFLMAAIVTQSVTERDVVMVTITVAIGVLALRKAKRKANG